MTRTTPELVLFDIAGTLIADTGLTLGAYRTVLEEEGMPFDARWLKEHIGCRKSTVFAAALRRDGRDPDVAEQLADRFAACINTSIQGDPPPVLPGVHETFAILHARGSLVGLVTGFHASTARCLQEASGWNPDVLVGSDEVVAGRPAPDLVVEAMRRSGVEDAAVVASVGDTPRDLDMAATAGCGWNIGVTTGSYTGAELRERPHTAILTSMDELPGELGVA